MLRALAATTLPLCVMAGARAQVFERTDAQREIELGRQVAAEVERALPVSRDPAMQERVRRIGRALVESMPARAYPYQFTALEVPEFNAFCLPGGFMYVYEGLLTKLPDDDAVAFVLAHEITHAAHRHWRRMVEKMKGPALLAALATAALGAGDVADMAATLVGAQYSREQESDADTGGVRLMCSAGYDPTGAVTAAQAMADMEKGSQIPYYLRSHPPARDRVKALQGLATQVAPSRQAPASRSTQLTTPCGMLPVAATMPCRWFPLSVGREWRYAVSAAGGSSRYAVRIVGKVTTDRGDVWRASLVLPRQVAISYQVLTTDSTVWRRDRPTRLDSAWRKEGGFATESGPFQVERASPLTTPCGCFEDVLRVRTRDGDRIVDAWYAAGVGLVKRTDNRTGVTETLVGYDIARDPLDEAPGADRKAPGSRRGE